ncbi:MAG: hypothetical protein KC503_01895 [Myxococcales bacterium]|nr:hypothetical protein [Myxococcales bacterium]
MHARLLMTLLASCLALAPACSDDSSSAGDGGGPGTDGLADAWVGNQPACNGTVYACSDGKDNDGDGLIDAEDPECVGPCDNDEGSFATGIPGDNVDACKQDCFFDGNSGQGDDKCEWNLKCDPKSPGANAAKACPYDPNYKNCPTTQSAACIKNCRALTPNGCDCFGCCQVFINGTPRTIYLGSGPECSVKTPDKCAECTQVADCNNDCGECELCLGKTIDDLPAKCFASTPDAGPGQDASAPKLPTCSDGLTPCLANTDCPAGLYCVTGCCIAAIQ